MSMQDYVAYMSFIVSEPVISEVHFSKTMGRTDAIGVIERKEVRLFSFYDDELYFTEDEMIGMTEEQAKELFRRRDIAYLQS